MSEISYLDELKEQHRLFCIQRDQTQTNLQQLVGAIYACELMITKLGSEQGDVSDVKADEPETEQATQE